MDRPDFTLACDLVLIGRSPAARNNAPHLLLIKRGNDPFRGSWALPGGRVERGEQFTAAARRELLEEAGIAAPAELALVGVYDEPARDPRGRVISVAYLGVTNELAVPAYFTNAGEIEEALWFPLSAVMDYRVALAFDHRVVALDAMAAWRRLSGVS